VKWETGHDESVEVNQRALIDKVLARYSGEFTVFRELLQNSDDAQSKAVEIRFQTQDFLDGEQTTGSRDGEALPDLKTTSASPDVNSLAHDSVLINWWQVHQWVFRNDGNTFRDEDWSRLKKIGTPILRYSLGLVLISYSGGQSG